MIGAWTWNGHYGVGIATEVGLDEADGVLARYQRQTRMGTGLSVLLIVAMSGLFAWNRLAMAAAGARLESAYAAIRGHTERMEPTTSRSSPCSSGRSRRRRPARIPGRPRPW